MNYKDLTDEQKKQADFEYVLKNIEESYTPFHYACCEKMIELFRIKYPDDILTDDLEFEYDAVTRVSLIP